MEYHHGVVRRLRRITLQCPAWPVFETNGLRLLLDNVRDSSSLNSYGSQEGSFAPSPSSKSVGMVESNTADVP